jgi:putative transposase
MDALYPSDLTDAQWLALAAFIPPALPGGRPRTTDMRRVLDAMFYVARSGGAWRMLPKDYPPWETVYYYFRRFRKDGTWDTIHTALRDRVRLKHEKHKAPTAAILDSQSVKTTEKGGIMATTPVRRSTAGSDTSW